MANALVEQTSGKQKNNKGRAITLSSQRISDWAAGRNVPARFESLAPVLATLINMARRQGYTAEDSLLDMRQWRDLWLDSNTVAPKPVKNSVATPYLGLQSYRREDSELYFGRNRATEALLGLVAEIALGADRSGLIVLVGASGAGKSSLLAAGLIPALAESANEWAIATMRPGGKPLAALRTALGRDDESAPPVCEDSASAELDEWAPDRRRLLIVDQFEELFTACDDDDERDAFLAALERAVIGRPDHASIAIIAVRADFYARCLDYPMLAGALNRHSYVLDSMRLDELRDAIAGPAELAGLVLEPGLQELVISELCGIGAHRSGTVAGAGTLPLLSHVMEAVWQKREGKRLTVDGYRRSGGVMGSVATTAENAWDILTESQQGIAKQILLSLVTVGRNSRDTRRIVARAELLNSVENVAVAEAVLETLTGARLITIDGDSVCLAHEIVLDAWPRLRQWIDEDRAGYLVRRQLETDAAQWVATNHDESLLYRGVRLESAQEHSDCLVSDIGKQFLRASRAERLKAEHRARVTKSLMAILGVFLLVVTVGFFDRSRTAEIQRTEAIFQEVLAKADSLQDVDPSLSAQLNLVAYRLRPGDPDVTARLLSTQTVALATPLLGPDSPVLNAAFSSRGLLAAAYANGTVHLWNTRDPRNPAPTCGPITGIRGFASAAQFSPDGRILAIGGEDHLVRLWNVDDPARPQLLADPMSGGNGAIYNVVFSPDGRTLAAANDDHTVALWNIADPDHPVLVHRISKQDGSIRSAAFSPDGRVLATASDDRTVRLWNVIDPADPVPMGPPLGGFTAIPHSVAFSPDGRKLAAGSDDGVVAIWDTTDPASPRPSLAPLVAHNGKIWSLVFGPGGKTLITGGTDGTAKLWNVADARVQIIGSPLAGRRGGVFAVAISPDQRTVATGSQDGVVRLWSLPGAPFSPAGAVDTSTFDPQTKVLVTTSSKGKVQTWDIHDPHATRRLGEFHTGTRIIDSAVDPRGRMFVVLNQNPFEFRLYDISDPTKLQLISTIPLFSHFDSKAVFSPKMPLLVTSHDEHSIQVWNIADPKAPVPVGAPRQVSSGWITSMRFCPDGRMLYTADSIGAVKMWDMSEPGRPRQVGDTLQAGTGSIESLALSPDGLTLVSAGADKTARIWDVSKPDEPVAVGDQLTGYNSAIDSLDFSPDGNRLASGSFDGEVRLWDFSDRTHPSVIVLSSVRSIGPRRQVAFDSTGNYLAVSGYDEGLLVWDLDVDHEIQRICSVTRMVLDRNTWEQALPGLPYKPPCH